MITGIIIGYLFGVVSIISYAFWKKRKIAEAKAAAQQSRPEETDHIEEKRERRDYTWLKK